MGRIPPLAGAMFHEIQVIVPIRSQVHVNVMQHMHAPWHARGYSLSLVLTLILTLKLKLYNVDRPTLYSLQIPDSLWQLVTTH